MALSEDTIPKILKRPLWHFYVTSVVILSLSLWLWWAKYYTAPQQVFWRMVESSLSTKSYVVETEQKGEQFSLSQLVHVDTNNAIAHSLLKINQPGTKVGVEAIGTPKTDYSRFLEIRSDSGQSAAAANVINVWSKSGATPQTDAAPSGQQLYAQSTLGIGLPLGSIPLPIVDLSARDREELMRRIRSERIFSPNSATVKKERRNGRQVYTYDVQIQTIPYIRLMQVVAKQLGVSDLDSVDPNTYGNGQVLRAKMSVDVLSRHLTSIDTGQGFTQHFTAYGVPVTKQIPTDTISAAELQRRLGEIAE